MINKFDNRYSPIFRWDAESLLDESGNGLHLTGPTAIFRQIYENVIGLSPSIVLNRGGVSDVVLRDFDDITVQLLCMLRTSPSGTYLIAFQASGDTEGANYAWSVQLANANSLAYFSEFGPGGDTAYNASVAQRGLPAVGVPFNLTMRRRAVTGGVIVQFFINGVPFGPPSGILPVPTGATTSQLVLLQTGVNAELFGVEIDNLALSDAQILDAYNRTLGERFGVITPAVQSLWVGALTNEGATVVVRLTHASDDVAIAVTDSSDTTLVTDSVPMAHGAPAKFVLDGLTDDTSYTYEVYVDGEPIGGLTGSFTTLPAGNPATFTVAFSGDSITNSNAPVFDTINMMNPLMFYQMGDIHYHNYTTNEQTQYHVAFDEVLAQPRPAQLYREIPTVYGWDDHDGAGGNNTNGSAVGWPAACSVYRQRVPHYPLPHATAIYQTWDIGRVRFILTDQRSLASPNSATDNASKSMLGAAQKTWFKDLLSNSPGMLIVWICPRWFGTAPSAGADSWGGFSTERAEIATHVHNNCPGRFLVFSADVHGWGIDDGTNHDFLPGGGEPIPCFQAAPLDIAAPAMAGTYSEGSGAVNGMFGTMTVDDAGGASVDVTWKAYDSAATLLASTTFAVAL